MTRPAPRRSLPALLLALAPLALAATPAAAQEAPAGEESADDERRLTFNFRRASIQAFVGYLSREGGFSFVEDAGIQGDITAVAERPISREQALEVLRAWLLPRDRTLIRTGDVVRILTLEDAKRRGLPVRVGADPSQIADSEELVTQVMPLRYVQASDVKSELEGLLSSDGIIMIESTSNSLVVNDTSAAIRRFAQVLDALDRAVTAELHVKVYRLENARADEVATVIQDLFSEGLALGGGGDDDGGGRGRGRGRGGRMREMARMFLAGRGGGGGGGGASVQPVNVSEDARTNSVVVTAASDQLRLVDDLVAQLDAEPDPIVTQIRSFPLENADAAELAETLTALFEAQEAQSGIDTDQLPRFMRRMMRGRDDDEAASGSGDSRYAPQARFTTDARTNTLIVSATASDMGMIAALVEELDADPTEKSGVLVVPLRHADAENLANVLTQTLAEEAAGTSGAQQGGGGGGGRRQQQAIQAALAAQSSASGVSTTGLTGEVTVVPDAESNSLVFTSSPNNFDKLRAIVRDLDQARREVFIEVLIAEVQLNDRGELGIQWEAAFTNSVENAEEGEQTVGTDWGLDALGDGIRWTTSSDQITGLLRALKTEGRLNILSSPKLLVVENTDAELSVGQEVPFVTNSRITQNGDTVNTIQYRDVGIILRVTPQVNDDGLVRLVVHPEVSSIAPESQSVTITEGVRSPTFNRNFADTTIVVGSGETAVIGGLIRDEYSETEFKIPFLGDIPIIGPIFGSTIREKVKQEMVVFLTPHVIEDAGQLRERSRITYSKYAYIPHEVMRVEMDRWVADLEEETHAWCYNRGTVYLESGRIHEAIQALEQAVALEPEDCAARFNLGLALAQAGLLERAAAELREAERCDPSDPQIPYNRGAVLWRLGAYDEAVAAFGRALALDPSHEEARRWLPKALRAAEQAQGENE